VFEPIKNTSLGDRLLDIEVKNLINPLPSRPSSPTRPRTPPGSSVAASSPPAPAPARIAPTSTSA
jgi:hypothetical protein